jgi:hypothetical protein
MDHPETLATLGTQDKEQSRQTKNKNTTHQANMGATPAHHRTGDEPH